MTIFRVNKTRDYSIISNIFLNDTNLSWKAKGVMAWLLSRPDDWQIYMSDLENRSTDGIDSVRSGINELINNGYIHRKRVQTEIGTFSGWEYQVSENPTSENPTSENPTSENPTSENPTLLNTNKTNYLNKINTNKTKNNRVSLESHVIDVYDYFNKKNMTNHANDKEITKGLSNILKTYTIEDVKCVIDFMANKSSWYYLSKNNLISVLAKPTKFYEKLEKARQFKPNPLSNLENKVYEGDF